MLKTLSRPALSVLAILAAVGCSKPNPIIGKWQTTAPGTAIGAGPQIVIEFDDKGGMKESLQAQGLALTADSSYKAENGELTQTLKSATVGGKTIAGSGQTKAFRYAIDGDTMTLQSKTGSGSMTLTRVKE